MVEAILEALRASMSRIWKSMLIAMGLGAVSYTALHVLARVIKKLVEITMSLVDTFLLWLHGQEIAEMTVGEIVGTIVAQVRHVFQYFDGVIDTALVEQAVLSLIGLRFSIFGAVIGIRVTRWVFLKSMELAIRVFPFL